MKEIVLSHPGCTVTGTVQLPASKSISNRLLIMKAVSGFSDLPIYNLSDARDTVLLKSILGSLNSKNHIDVQDAGTVMRFLTAYLSCVPGEWVITGTERMLQRPIDQLVGVLRKMGAEILYTAKENYPPLKINGKKLEGGQVEIDGSVSSQFISALLMVSPLFKNPLELHIRNGNVSEPYINMTLTLMKQWGAEVNRDKNLIRVNNTAYKIPAKKLFVEGDWSAASYFYSMLGLATEGELKIPHLSKESLQGDQVCATLFEELGVSTFYMEEGIHLKKNNSSPGNFTSNFVDCPDLAQTFAVYCAAKGIEARLSGLQTLSLKETDRIRALQTELQKLGHRVKTTPSSLHISPPSIQPGVKPRFQSYADHRMAMSFAPLALIYPEITIENSAVVEKSFPHFWEELKKIGFSIS